MDPSSSNLNWEQRGIITYMDTDKYKAASEGNVDAFKDYTEPLDHLVTHTKNTVLHIHLSNPTVSTEFVKHILGMCPSLLKQANIKGETPLHFAATHGHDDAVKVLIESATVGHEDLESGVEPAKEMLRMTNKEKNTALHEAVRRNHVDVVKVLIEEDPHFPYSANDNGETPIYMAALRGYLDIVVEILQNCTSKSYGGPNGKTALHAAVIRGDEEMTRKILEKANSLTQEADQKGWTPLHYASDFCHSPIVKLLLEYDKSAAYIPDRDGKIPLHIAVSRDHRGLIGKLLRNYPDCCKLVDNRGWNVFHFAMEIRSFGAMRELYSHSFTKHLVNEKDFEGNTPLHLLAASWSDKDDEIYLPLEVDVMAVNQRNQSAMNIFRANNDLPSSKKVKILTWLRKRVNRNVVGRNDIKKTLNLFIEYDEEVSPRLEKAKEYHLVVAALIATVTFAAAFTVPGGYISEKGPDQGTPILRRSSAFQAFVITDALAMMSSTSAVFIHFLMALGQYKGKYLWIFIYTFLLTVFAMGAMVAAFVTGTYAVLGPSPGLAIATCVIGLCFFLHPAFAISIIMPIVGKIIWYFFDYVLRKIRDLFRQCFVRD